MINILWETNSISEETLKKVWKNLRDVFTKCHKKRELLTRSGAAYQTLPKCRFFTELQFIKDSNSNRLATSNINCDMRNDSDSQQGSPLNISDGQEKEGTSSVSFEVSTPRKAKRIRKKAVSPDVDVAIIEALKKEEDKPTVMDADAAFANSIVPLLKNLEPRANREAKIEIQQVLLKYEFDYHNAQ